MRNPNCALCLLSTGVQTVCIDGDGPADAQVLFIGEAPGADEDRTGIPFVGRAGRQLDTLAAEYGFKRSEVRVSNAVRCRPPENREPTTKERKACRNYLIEEIRAVQPRVVVALGNVALQTLIGKSGIGKHRTEMLPLHPDFGTANTQVLATFHPSASLQYPHFTDQIREDFALLRRSLDGNFTVIPVSWSWSASTAPMGQVLSFDLETNARETRDPFTHVYLCAIDDGTNEVRVYSDIDAAASVLGAAAEIVGHNASRFDRIMLRAAGNAGLKTHDTMLMAWLLHEEWGVAKRLNLESLCTTLLGIEPWKKDVTWNWREARSIPWERAGLYNARDTRYTLQLFNFLRPKLQEQSLTHVYEKLLLPASRAIADMEERGLWINDTNVAEAWLYYREESARHLQTVATIAGDENFNPRSTKQVGELLFGRLGFNPVNWTDHGAPSTNVEALKTMREFQMGDSPEILDALLQYRKAEKMRGTYLLKFARQRDAFGMVYPWTSLTNTVTGRTSGDYQQIPREPRVRRCIGAPPGKVLLQADYSQLEMRVAASRYVFDEPNLRNAFARGDDVHRLLATEITRKPYEDITKEERARAKPPNFLFLYGGEEDMYVRTLLEDYDIVKDRATATMERDAFFRRWNRLPAGHARWVNTLKEHGEVRSALGTLRRLPNVFSKDRRVKVECFRQAINFVDQAFACHIALIGLCLLSAAGLDVRSFQHDAYLLYVDDNEGKVRETAGLVRYLMEQGVPAVLKSEFGVDFDVPLVADLTVGTAWTDDDRQAWLG